MSLGAYVEEEKIKQIIKLYTNWLSIDMHEMMNSLCLIFILSFSHFLTWAWLHAGQGCSHVRDLKTLALRKIFNFLYKYEIMWLASIWQLQCTDATVSISPSVTNDGEGHKYWKILKWTNITSQNSTYLINLFLFIKI